jgi:hypothetical protein
MREEDWEGAAVLYRAASDMDDSSATYLAGLAIALCNLDRCDDAEAAVQRAMLRTRDNELDPKESKSVLRAWQVVKQCRLRKANVDGHQAITERD